jgi:tryptophan synthase beta chain
MGMGDIKRQAPNVARMKMLGAEVRPHFQDPKTKRCDKTTSYSRLDQQSSRHHYIIGSVVGPHPYPDTGSFSKCHLSEIKTQLLEKKEQKT